MEHRIEAWYVTHQGGVRENNEDGILAGSILITDISMESPGYYQTGCMNHLFCVADGIGGEQKGEVASRIVLTALQERESSITNETNLRDALGEAKEELELFVTLHPDSYNLGCTLAGVCIQEDQALIFNIGDCRVYRINGNYFEQITHDHSIVQSLYDEGVITEDEMRTHPRKNVITSSVSGDGKHDSIRIFATMLNMRREERFFLCSDGIWECFSHDELEMIYQRFQGEMFCEKILGAALARGASDNITALMLHRVCE